MAVKWTQEQEKVISLRDRNILVSAAAGSGKTAVLVQRIISKITDKKKPVDIDRLLIMTFTRAAAGEMRERIGKALENALYEEPENEHLQRQMNLIHTAQITTIDGFCSYIIRNYFHLIGLDPGYKTADEGELKLLKEDVLKELLEEEYVSGGEAFHNFVECYAGGKTDEGIKEYILNVYEAAMSHPDPRQWLDQCLEIYKMESMQQMKESSWMQLLWEAAEEEVVTAGDMLLEAKEICTESDGPYLYEEALDSDLIFLEELKKKIRKQEFDYISELLGNLSFTRLSSKKMEGVQEQKKELVKELREEYKGILKELKTHYFLGSIEQIYNMMLRCREPMECLISIVCRFMDLFSQKKREKNLLDFTDMEHFALDILMGQGGEMSQAARELSEKYEEVLIDEYQDSNLVQEYLAACVSGWVKDKKNIFMVGDVKQSIYRFRLARPELFMEKYKTYSLEESKEQRIDLHKNFRSRPEVLESVNFIFQQIMGEDLGGISYDQEAALYPGASYPDGADQEFVKTRVLFVEKDGEELSDAPGSVSPQELEALAIAQEIHKIVGKEKVLDKETGEYRLAQYGDIAVLLRSAYGWAEVFSQVFDSKGIPSYAASRTGYFATLEITTVLNFLKVCDNPLQDIPLAGVLRSPMIGCTSQELAMIKKEFPTGMLYESLCAFAQDGQMELFPEEDGKTALQDKLRVFLFLLEKVRTMAAFTPIHQLILYVIDATGYGEYVRALPGGEQRSANIHMLVEKAMEYEKSSYRGLFNFVRYIESLQKYQIDFGETNISGDGKEAVQIMTIHKSKGLEFPVVFAAGMGKQFNFQDMNARILIHPEMGLGTDAILPDKRLIISNLHKQLVRRALLKESLGEELRVLYVALTRAKEKLIITGTLSKIEKQIWSLARYREREEVLLPIGTRIKARSYWGFLLPALARNSCMDELYLEYGLSLAKKNSLYRKEDSLFIVDKVTVADLVQEDVLYQTEEILQEERLKNWDASRIYDESVRRKLEERFTFSYPFGILNEIPVKVSVTELKKQKFADDYEKEENIFYDQELTPVVPAFISAELHEMDGPQKGTAYHRFMECLDYSQEASEKQLQQQLTELLRLGKMNKNQVQSICIKEIMDFLQSSLGQRMRLAQIQGDLFREQPFVATVDADKVNPEWKTDEKILVQGIIDAYFIEKNEVVLVDYKTDKVKPWEEKRLAERYSVQLKNYQEALEKLLGLKVKEKYIYSFALSKEILV